MYNVCLIDHKHVVFLFNRRKYKVYLHVPEELSVMSNLLNIQRWRLIYQLNKRRGFTGKVYQVLLGVFFNRPFYTLPFFLIYILYWSTVALQCFRCTARWFSYTFTHILFFQLFSIIGYYKILTIVPCITVNLCCISIF